MARQVHYFGPLPADMFSNRFIIKILCFSLRVDISHSVAYEMTRLKSEHFSKYKGNLTFRKSDFNVQVEWV